jgi:RHS repeat-associated protein
VYVNEFFTIRNREVGTKHVHAGNTRMVSKLMKQQKPGTQNGGTQPREKDLYFWHPDHLGGGNYITDPTGKLYEHLEYFPSGETWVDESTNTQRTPYLFTSKELDEETNLYYYGARYYDPRLSSFISTDPLLFKDPGRGNTDSHFYNLYAYAQQNPIKFIDPDGLDVIIAIGRDPKDSVAAANFKAVALALQKSLKAADPNIKVHIVDQTGTKSIASKIEAKGKEIAKNKGKVSTLIYLGHGNGANTLAPEGYGTAGLAFKEAAAKAGLADNGAAIALACFVGDRGLYTKSFEDKKQRVYATENLVDFADNGQAGVKPPMGNSMRHLKNPGDVVLPEHTGKGTKGESIQQATVAAEKRVK